MAVQPNAAGLQAAILVGGRGTRLGALTAQTPKPLLDVAGRPMLDHLIDVLAAQGVRRVVLLAGHLGGQLQDLARRPRPGLSVTCIVEPEPAGTGGALAHARHVLDAEFLLLNGDSYFDVDVADLAARGRAIPEAAGILALRDVPDTSRYGSIVMDGARIAAFAEKRAGSGLVNGGVYWLRRSVLDHLSALPCSIEQDVFPALAQEGRLFGQEYHGFFIDIGVPEDLVRAQTELPAALARRG